MRITAILAGLFLCAVTFLTVSSPVHAEAPQQIKLGNSTNIIDESSVLAVVSTQLQSPKVSDKAQPALQEHVVASGETLTSIASQYQTTWQRLYAKNTNLNNPDVIDVGVKLVVPSADEQLAERAAPVSMPETASTAGVSSPAQPAAVQASARGSSGGNTYSPGYCTWYAKSRRPDLPNNLGNANTWVARAAAQGIPTGSAPSAGAIGQQGMHVVYVESVNGDGTITISEMNHAGWNVVSSRTVPASTFTYIY